MRRLGCAIALAIAAGACGRADPAPAAEAAIEVEDAFRWERTIGSDGEVSERTVGDMAALELVDTGLYAVGLGSGSSDGTTTTTTFSVEAVDVRPADAEMRERRLAGRGTSDAAPVLDERFQALVDAGSDETVDAIVLFDDSLVGSESIAEELTLVMGTDYAPDEAGTVRTELVRARFDETLAAQAPIVSRLTDLGATVVEQFVAANGARVTVSARSLVAISRDASVRRVEPVVALEPLGVDGEQALIAHQLQQYLNAGYDGAEPNPSQHSFAGIAVGFLDFSFEDDFDSIGDSRVQERWNCQVNPCVSVADANAALNPPVLVPPIPGLSSRLGGPPNGSLVRFSAA